MPVLKDKKIMAFGLLPLLTILIYTLAFYRHSFLSVYVIGFSLLLIALFVLSLFFNGRFWRILRYPILIFDITYVLMEFATYVLLSLGIIRSDIHFFSHGLEGTSRGIAIFDSISGYRAVPGDKRYMCIDNGKLEFDHITRANSQGWYSDKEYRYKKTKPRVKRYMVLGDSFSAGLVVPTPWPDLVQKMLLEKGNDSIELYNFSLDGAGIQNWYRTLMYEIVPKYEFDGIIVAAGAEKNSVPDLDRRFFMADSYNGATWVKLDDIVSKSPSFSRETAAPMIQIFSNEEMDNIKRKFVSKSMSLTYKYQAPDLCFLRTLYGVTDGLHRILAMFEHNQPYEYYYKLADEPYKMEYFDKRYRDASLLKQMISYCKANGKDVILVNIPDYENGIDYINGRKVIYCNEHQFLSQFYGIKSFDGFHIFDGKNEAFAAECFYEFNRHWNRFGVEEFSHRMVESGILSQDK